ncbi:interferon kappa [Lepus europaeus]|uniref:interferon kappa n=1 Tax=Lepus europaeus TaxID=9983 RepID=UPI002B4A6169|nr:interferon kappa [Lepus europaeus]
MANRTLLELTALVLHWILQNYLGKDAETDKTIKVFHPHAPYALVTILPDMIQKCWWLAFLMGLFIIGFQALDCDFLNVNLNRVIWKNMKLLRNVSHSFPIGCLREIKDFELPQEILSHTQMEKRDIKEAWYEISTQAFYIFMEHAFQPTWEEKHLTQILNGLYEQVAYLEQCLKEDIHETNEEEMKHSGTGGFLLNNLELRKYFYRMNNFLEDKKYSHCAWEIVRVEITRCFSFFYRFTAFLRRR